MKITASGIISEGTYKWAIQQISTEEVSSGESEALLLDSVSQVTGRLAAHSTINCYRSAISLLVGSEMAHDQRVTSFLKVFLNEDPQCLNKGWLI